MSKIETMNRVLIDHNWTSLEEWVGAIRELADLDDQALDEIRRFGCEGEGTRRAEGG